MSSADNNNQKPLSREDLGSFTEEVLLPAMDKMIDEKLDTKFDEKLKPIYEELSFLRHEVFKIKEDLEILKEKVDRIATSSGEDVVAVNKEVQLLKKRVKELENELERLKS